MTNKELLEKLKEDMEMRGFSKYTKYSYYHRAKEIIEYFGKSMELVEVKELRSYLMRYLKDEKKLTETSINYYNNTIRFIYDVVIDKPKIVIAFELADSFIKNYNAYKKFYEDGINK